MEIWQEIKKDKERGARRLVAEYGNRIFAAALLLSSDDLDAEELTFKTLGRAVEKIHLEFQNAGMAIVYAFCFCLFGCRTVRAGWFRALIT
jgi:hypothetical protein